MTNSQILNKAIDKALMNDKNFENQDAIYAGLFSDFRKELLKDKNYYKLIFSHDFCRAFWGKKEQGTTYKEDIVEWEIWQRHLAEMVLEKDPLKYLKQFLGDN
jgi:hypothetical protein